MSNDMPFENRHGLQRQRPRSRNGLLVEEIENKTNGNYIFSFGFPGSGKTTFQWMMMNYLMNEGPFRTEISVPDRADGPDWDGRATINSWKSQWIEGRFPDPTAAGEGDIREIEVKTKTTSGKKMELDFSFLEVSGELLRQVLPDDGIKPRLAPLLSAYLGNPNLKFTIILVINPDVEKNDHLFASFFTYLKKIFPGLVDRVSLGIIISKPERALEKLNEFGSNDGRMNFPTLNADAIEAYMNRFCGETFQIWNDWPKANSILISPLNLGIIEQQGHDMFLVEPHFKHIEQIFLWLFEQFTGNRPGPTFFQKLIGKMDWK